MNEVPVLIESIASLLTSYTTNSVGTRTSEYKYFRDKGTYWERVKKAWVHRLKFILYFYFKELH